MNQLTDQSSLDPTSRGTCASGPAIVRPKGPAECEIAGTAARVLELSRMITDAESGEEDAGRTGLALACDLVPGARWASLTRRNGEPVTTAASHPHARALDVLQYRAGEGPCLTALDTTSVIVSDFATETRWPAFISSAAADSPARAALAYPLESAGHPATTLNLYSDVSGAFDGLVLHTAALTAAGLALALTAIDQHRRAAHLEIGLASSRLIGAAVGILMHRYRWTYDQAFDALRTTSQHSHRKLRDLADHVLLTGDLAT